MRRSDREVTKRAAMEEILHRARVCRLGMSDQAGPYVVPVCFGYEAGRIFVHGAASGRKMDCIRAQPRVAFEVTLGEELVYAPSACDFGMKYQCVMGVGVVEVLETAAQRSHGLDCIMRKYSKLETPDYRDSVLSRTVVLGITIETMTMKAVGYELSD